MTRMSNLRSKCPLHFAESALRSEQKKGNPELTRMSIISWRLA